MTLEQHGLVVEGGVRVATFQAHAARDVKKLAELQTSDHTDVGVSRSNCALSGGRNAMRV